MYIYSRELDPLDPRPVQVDLAPVYASEKQWLAGKLGFYRRFFGDFTLKTKNDSSSESLIIT